MKKYLLPVICYTSMTIGIVGLAACGGPGRDDAATHSRSSSAAIARVAAPEKLKPNTDALQWRFIGPITGNRGSAVVGHPTDKNVFYFGASSGLWKTPDAGFTWAPLGAGQFKTGHVGAIELSQSDPDTLHVRPGEPQMRNNASWCDGVYTSLAGS